MAAVRKVIVIVLVAACGAIVQAQAQWPQWRGVTGNGVATGAPPAKWSDTANVKWKVEIPGRGHSTPVAWGDRLYLTTAIPTGKGASAQGPDGGRGAGGGRAAGRSTSSS